MAIGDVAQSAFDPYGLVGSAETLASFVGGNLPGITDPTVAGKGSSPLMAMLSMSIGDYTLVAVGIILALGALLISSKPTVIKAVGTVKDAVALS